MIPNGKNDLPIIMLQGNEVTVDCDEVDGQMAMLDREFSGCVTLVFSKPINKEIPGKVTIDGHPLRHFHHFLNYRGGMELLCVYAWPYFDKYDHIYTLRVEGFIDTDGNMMLPDDIPVRTLPKPIPNEDDAKSEAVALQAAEEGIVLMKNDNAALPIMPGIVNIFGVGQHLFRHCAVGAGKVNSRYTIGLKRAIRESEDFTLNEELADFYKGGDDKLPGEALLSSAKSQSDTAIIVLSRFGGENTDNSTAKGEFYLTDDEERMIETVNINFNKTIVVLNTPNPIDVRLITQKCDALLYMGFGGMLGGAALLNTLSGKVNPSGKLTDTWAMDYFDIPASMNFYDCAVDGPRHEADADIWIDTVYEEDIYVGYRYFETFGVQPAFPFGYGLSYTNFSLSCTTPTFDLAHGLKLSAAVKNIGSTAGKEVVQVYISKPDGELEQPDKELVAFEKTDCITPGEAVSIDFAVPCKHLVSYNESRAAYVLVAGTYKVFVGTSVSQVTMAGSFIVSNEVVIKLVKNRLQPNVPIKTLTKHDPSGSWPKGEFSGVVDGASGIQPARLNKPRNALPMPAPDTPVSFNQVLDNPNLLCDFVAQLDVQALCRLTVCAKAGWNMSGTGISGYLAIPENTDICSFQVADGNSGIRVDPKNTGFPATAVFCASFNKALMYEIGQVLGKEAIERDVDLVTAPGMNMHRNPLGGRNIEYFSEDPYLTGVMAGHFVAGIEDTGVGAGYKHVLGNECETSRKRNQSIMTERALREIYFRAFELAIEVCNPVSVMTAYNAVNGVHTAADAELIHGLLREENDFKGCVMTDWNSYDSCDLVDIVLGGNNWLTPGSLDDTHTKPLIDAFKSGRLPIAVLQESVAYLLYTVVALKRRRKEKGGLNE